MGQKLLGELASIATIIIGVAIVAVIVSKNSQTSTLITDAGNSFSNIVKRAVSPAS